MSPVELSVIIPTRDRPHEVHRCLGSLAAQTQPAEDFEIIVVVDGGRTAVELPPQLQGRARVVVQAAGGPGVARNRGVELAQGRWCLFLDDDVVADPNLVAEHMRAHRADEGIVGLGRLVLDPGPRAGGFARYMAACREYHFSRLADGSRSPSWRDCYAGNMSVPREALLAVGGFSPDLSANEDLELGYRLERHGLRFVYLPAAVACERSRPRFIDNAVRSQRTGVGDVEIYLRHPSLVRELDLADPRPYSLRAYLARRLLSALGGPVRPLALVGPLVRHPDRRRRWYRFLAHYLYWQGVRRAVGGGDLWRRLNSPSVILMYHAFADGREARGRYVVPVRRFRRQMAWLRLARYRVLSLDEYVRYRRRYEPPPARSVVITIDDGFQDAGLALSVLRRYRFPAALFLVAGKVGGRCDWTDHPQLRGRPLLSWEEARGAAGEGIAFGAHTLTHPLLPSLPLERVRDEVAGSRRAVESGLGYSVSLFG